jgi:hypothetical protein
MLIRCIVGLTDPIGWGTSLPVPSGLALRGCANLTSILISSGDQSTTCHSRQFPTSVKP